MSLFDLLFEYGNPSSTYTDGLVAAFYAREDKDGAWFSEALSELPDADRARIIDLINDPTSRTLSHQMVGQIVVDQLRKYPRNFLAGKYQELRGEIDKAKGIDAKAEKADLDNDGQQSGCLP